MSVLCEVLTRKLTSRTTTARQVTELVGHNYDYYSSTLEKGLLLIEILTTQQLVVKTTKKRSLLLVRKHICPLNLF